MGAVECYCPWVSARTTSPHPYRPDLDCPDPAAFSPADLAKTIRGDASNIKIVTKIDLSCGCERSFWGHAGSIRVGEVWGCDKHGNAVIMAIATTIDGVIRDALVWISDRIGTRATATDRPDQPIESVRLARRPAHLQGDLGLRHGTDTTATGNRIDLGDDPDGDLDGADYPPFPR